MSERVYVLDVGTTKVACLEVERNSTGQFSVHVAASVSSRGVKKGVVVDRDLAAVAIDEATRKAQELRGGGEMGPLVVGLGGHYIQALTSQGFMPIYPSGRNVNREDVLHVINHSRQIPLGAGREQVCALPREFRIDGRRGIHQPVGIAAGRLEVLTCILSGRTADLDLLEQAVRLAGRRVDQVVPTTMAAGLAVSRPEERERGIAVVDIGGGTTNVSVFLGGSLAMAFSLPVSGGSVTNDLKLMLKVSSADAERLKIAHGVALASGVDERESIEVPQEGVEAPRQMLRQAFCAIIESRLREIAGMVRDKLSEGGVLDQLEAGVAVTGGSSVMPGIGNLFEEILHPSTITVRSPQVGGSFGGVASRPAMAAVVGLARYALESVQDELSTAVDEDNWRSRVRSFWSLLSGKA